MYQPPQAPGIGLPGNQYAKPGQQFSSVGQGPIQFEAPPMEPRGGKSTQGGKPTRPVINPKLMNLYLIGIGIFGLIHFSYILFLRTRTDIDENVSLRVISDIIVLLGPTILAITAGVATWKLIQMRQRATDIVVRRAWIVVACWGMAGFLNAIGQFIWTWMEATNTLVFPGPYDIFYLAVYPFQWVAMAMIMPRNRTLAGRTRVLLDAGIVVTSILAGVWYFIIGPRIAILTDNTFERTTALGYPLGDLSLFVAASILLFGQVSGAALGNTVRRLSMGVTVLSVTSLLYAYFTLQGIYKTGFLSDVGWPLGWLLIGWSMLGYANDLVEMGQQSRTYEPRRNVRLGTVRTALRAITPALIALATCGLLIFGVALTSPGLLTQVMIVCAGLFLLPLIRQALTLIDNLILNDRLHVALDQSQQAFQHSQRELVSTTIRAEQYEELRIGIEELQNVHAHLARGDLSVRARVQGTLAPVAQSLNLSLERMGRLSQQVQQNQVLQREAENIYHVAEVLNEGKLTSNFSKNPSALASGRSLFAVVRLQSRLQQRFRRLRELTEQLTTRIHQLADLAVRSREGQDKMTDLQKEQILAQLDRGLKGSEDMLKELQTQTAIFMQDATPKLQDSYGNGAFNPGVSGALQQGPRTNTPVPQRSFPDQGPFSQDGVQRRGATGSWQ